MRTKTTSFFRNAFAVLSFAFIALSNQSLYSQVTSLEDPIWTSGTTHAAVDGINRALVVILFSENGNANIATAGATYGGKAMTKINETSITNGSFYTYVGAYVLGETGIATATSDVIAVSWINKADNAAITPGGTFVSSAFFQYVNQASLVGASAVSAVTNTPNIAITGLENQDGDLAIVAAAGAQDGAFTFTPSDFKMGVDENVGAIGGLGSAIMDCYGEVITPSAVNANATIARLTMIGFVLKKGSTTGLETQKSNLFNIFSAGSNLNLQLQSGNMMKEVIILNSVGVEIYSTKINDSKLSINTKSLGYKGVALVKVVSEGNVQSQKFMMN